METATVVRFPKKAEHSQRKASRLDRLRCLMNGHSYGSGPDDVEWRRDRNGAPLEFSCARRCGYWTDRPIWVGAWLAWGAPLVIGAGTGVLLAPIFVSLWHGPVVGACFAALGVVFWGDRPHFTAGALRPSERAP
jgi:hypothetical protein